VALVIDDHLLLGHLVGRLTGWMAQQVRESAVYTTASWYYRVANAATHGSGSGSLSGQIASLPDDEQQVFRSKIASLPDSIGLVGPRTLVPIMAAFHTPRRLNYLNAEALALAVVAEASIVVRTDSPLLRDACETMRVDYRVVDAP
jgi:hypothetical protein